MIYRLNSAQRFLLQSLVHFVGEGKVKEPIGVFPLGNPPTAYAIHLRGEPSFVFENYGDLDVLCLMGMLGFCWNRTGLSKLYYLTEAGETAVRHNFKTFTPPIGFDVYLPDVIQVMSGGWLDVTEMPEVSLSDLAGDLKLRRVVVEVLTERLLTAVYALLTKEEFTVYRALAEQFRDRLLHVPVTVGDLKRMYQSLFFWDDLMIETNYIIQAQPLLQALWLVAVLRMGELQRLTGQ